MRVPRQPTHGMRVGEMGVCVWVYADGTDVCVVVVVVVMRNADGRRMQR